MVISLTGTVDSVPVIFKKVEHDLWEATVPPDLHDGRYIVELIATDDAGNQTYEIAELWMWQRVITHFKVIEQPYKHTLLFDKYQCECRTGFYTITLKDTRECVDGGDKFCIRIL